MGGKWLSPDVVALSVPIAAAMGGFSFMIARAFLIDPEWSNGMQFYEKPDAEKWGKYYRMQYQQFFPDTGAQSKMLFPNRVQTA